MCSNVDHSHLEVRRDLFYWLEWLASQLKLGGLRIDAIKHIPASFLRDMLKHINQNLGQDWFIVGEYWRGDARVLSGYIEYMENRISLFDVPLLENFSKVSHGIIPDFRRVFEGSLAAIKPEQAVVSLLCLLLRI